MGRFFIPFFACAIGVAALFFPIVEEADIYCDLQERKAAFAVFLFGCIKIAGGYAALYREGIALHLSEKTAVLLPFADGEERKKRFKFMKILRLMALQVTVETGAEYFLQAKAGCAALKTALFIRRKNKRESGYFRKNSFVRLWLTDGNTLKLTVKVTAYFNLAGLVKAFFRFIGKIVKREWENRWKKREKAKE